MIEVQLPTLRYRYIRADIVAQFRKDHPDAVGIL